MGVSAYTLGAVFIKYFLSKSCIIQSLTFS
nr:MAG TPA: hypothetical protein [Caudoviricetes sp.]